MDTYLCSICNESLCFILYLVHSAAACLCWECGLWCGAAWLVSYYDVTHGATWTKTIALLIELMNWASELWIKLQDYKSSFRTANQASGLWIELQDCESSFRTTNQASGLWIELAKWASNRAMNPTYCTSGPLYISSSSKFSSLPWIEFVCSMVSLVLSTYSLNYGKIAMNLRMWWHACLYSVSGTANTWSLCDLQPSLLGPEGVHEWSCVQEAIPTANRVHKGRFHQVLNGETTDYT